MQPPVKYFHKRLNSTNLYVSQMVSELNKKEPLWVRTDEQFAGKGQGSNTWLSEPGKNLTGTLAIFPDHMESVHQFSLSQLFALSAASFLEIFVDDIRLKWPNDLYAGDLKIGGILIETATLGKWISHAILGLGVNINQEKFPADLPNPVSLTNLTGIRYDLTELENLFLDTFLNHYSLLESGRLREINDQYISRLYGLNELRDFRSAGRTFCARITGVNDFGHLALQTPSGDTQTYAYQEIEYLINPVR